MLVYMFSHVFPPSNNHGSGKVSLKRLFLNPPWNIHYKMAVLEYKNPLSFYREACYKMMCQRGSLWPELCGPPYR